MVSASSPQRTLLKLVPYSFLLPFAGGATMAPSLYVFRYLVCLAWFTSKDPSHLPSGPDDARCSSREIEARYTSMIAAFAVISGVTGLIATSPVQRLTDRFGRRAFLLGLPMLECISCMVLLFAFSLTNTTVIYILVSCNAVLSAISVLSGFIPTLIIADVAAVEDRTPWYSRITGANLLGLGLAMVATDTLTRATGSFGTFRISIALQFFTAVYAFIVIPETRKVPEAAPELTTEAPKTARIPTTTRALQAVLLPLAPLGLLLPRKSAETGKRNWTLFLLACSVFMSTFAGGFPTLALILYLQQHFHFTPGENGYVLAWSLGTKFFYLVFVFPIILKYGRRAFHRYQLRHPIHQSIVEAPALVDETTPLMSEETPVVGEVAQEGEVLVIEKPEALANHFDVILAYFSLLLEMAGMLLVALSTSWQQIVFAFAVLSMSAGFRPSTNSAFLACVPAAQSSEVLASIEILTSISGTASSLILGPLYAVLVKSGHAPIMFAVAAALYFIGSLFLLPIKRI